MALADVLVLTMAILILATGALPAWPLYLSAVIVAIVVIGFCRGARS